MRVTIKFHPYSFPQTPNIIHHHLFSLQCNTTQCFQSLLTDVEEEVLSEEHWLTTATYLFKLSLPWRFRTFFFKTSERSLLGNLATLFRLWIEYKSILPAFLCLPSWPVLWLLASPDLTLFFDFFLVEKIILYDLFAYCTAVRNQKLPFLSKLELKPPHLKADPLPVTPTLDYFNYLILWIIWRV